MEKLGHEGLRLSLHLGQAFRRRLREAQAPGALRRSARVATARDPVRHGPQRVGRALRRLPRQRPPRRPQRVRQPRRAGRRVAQLRQAVEPVGQLLRLQLGQQAAALVRQVQHQRRPQRARRGRRRCAVVPPARACRRGVGRGLLGRRQVARAVQAGQRPRHVGHLPRPQLRPLVPDQLHQARGQVGVVVLLLLLRAAWRTCARPRRRRGEQLRVVREGGAGVQRVELGAALRHHGGELPGIRALLDQAHERRGWEGQRLLRWRGLLEGSRVVLRWRVDGGGRAGRPSLQPDLLVVVLLLVLGVVVVVVVLLRGVAVAVLQRWRGGGGGGRQQHDGGGVHLHAVLLLLLLLMVVLQHRCCGRCGSVQAATCIEAGSGEGEIGREASAHRAGPSVHTCAQASHTYLLALLQRAEGRRSAQDPARAQRRAMPLPLARARSVALL